LWDKLGLTQFDARAAKSIPTPPRDIAARPLVFKDIHMTSAAQTPPVVDATVDVNSTPPATATGVYVTIHGHFYQPPRENPYLNTIERQPSAQPFHDWNERIYHECYRPNVFARIVNENGNVVGIVNNFEYLSFNIGPTLMSWLERYDREVYDRIIAADRHSAERLNGHGNAIAQVYNHIIMPLASERDKYTQIRWGIADFRDRFGRDPEGIWLAETAVDYATLEALVNEGIRFTILAPSQAERCRLIPTDDNADPQWHAVGGSQIDPNRPYRCFLEDGRYIDLFFYDGPISRDMGFDDVLSSASHLAGRLGQAVRGDRRPAQLINVATDGETFGHHKHSTEKCIAYSFTQEFPQRGWTVTNYAHYLSLSPPTWEVILKPVTAWSCAHGVDRWQEDCGCGGGGLWHQKWRRPLRDTLNWLRDELADLYEAVGRKVFRDPWLARDEYIQVMRDRSPENIMQFLYRHQSQQLSPSEQIDALRLLEMQRHTLLMFTSCGWFFEEISRPEGVQILRYAARAIELAGDISGKRLAPEFRDRLREAPSNVETFIHGAEIYDRLVISSVVRFEQVAAHYAISSLFQSFSPEEQLYCYRARQIDYQKQQMGALMLAVGHLQLMSDITLESKEFIFAVLHLGGWDFHCCLQPFSGRLAYAQVKEQLFVALNHASVARMMVVMTQLFGSDSFNLENLFAEERHRLIEQLTENTKDRLDRLYEQVYRDNYGILKAFHRDELPVPKELQVAAEIALAHRCLDGIALLDPKNEDVQALDAHLAELEAIAAEAEAMRCHLKLPEVKTALERLINETLQHILTDRVDFAETDLQRLERAIDLGEKLNLGLSLDRAQEFYFFYLHHYLIPQCCEDSEATACSWQPLQVYALLHLGRKLAVNVEPWLR
jgi:alpha-amylase/alpha-mannosidase (GH57 family)